MLFAHLRATPLGLAAAQIDEVAICQSLVSSFSRIVLCCFILLSLLTAAFPVVAAVQTLQLHII